MFDKIFFWNQADRVLELDNLEELLQTSLHPIKPRSGYEANLKRRLASYPKTNPDLIIQKPFETQQVTKTNEPLFLFLGILSGAALLAMGIRVVFVILVTLGLARNLKRNVRRTNWPSSPHPAI